MTAADLAVAQAAFTAQRARLINEAQSALAQAQTAAVNVWGVSARQDTGAAARMMNEGIPHADRVFTLAQVFIGNDLAALRAMLGQG